jgi:hypothetical protein
MIEKEWMDSKKEKGAGADSHAVRVDAGTGRGKVVDTPPAHLQEDEADEKAIEGEEGTMGGHLAVVDIDEVSEPGDGSPRLLGIPRPIVAPGFFGP